MKRNAILLLTTLLLIVLSACSFSFETNTSGGKDSQEKESETSEQDNATADTGKASGDKEVLTLRVLKEDEENGVTIGNHNIYSELDNMIKENPDMGEGNDFSVIVVDSIYDDEGNAQILMLGINRTSETMKDISFGYTLGTEDGEYVFEDLLITMEEETAGALQPNSALPIVLPISPEQDTVLQKIGEGNQVVKVDNFKFNN